MKKITELDIIEHLECLGYVHLQNMDGQMLFMDKEKREVEYPITKDTLQDLMAFVKELIVLRVHEQIYFDKCPSE